MDEKAFRHRDECWIICIIILIIIALWLGISTGIIDMAGPVNETIHTTPPPPP